MMVLGAIFLVHSIIGIRLPVRQVLPVLLLLLGAYMLCDYLLRERRRKTYLLNFDSNPQMAAVIPANSGVFQTGELIQAIGACPICHGARGISVYCYPRVRRSW